MHEVWELSGNQPAALRDRPVTNFVQDFYLDIFNKLSKSRQFSMAGPLSIPVETALLAYCTFYGINDIEQRESIANAMHALDAVYLENAYKGQKST